MIIILSDNGEKVSVVRVFWMLVFDENNKNFIV